MPFFPNLTELRGIANNFNPLNVFSSTQEPFQPATPTQSAVAGPGPSTLARASTPPTRPAPNTTSSSSPDSLEDGIVRSKRSASNAVIAIPGVDAGGQTQRRPEGRSRRERPLSMVSRMTETSAETRRRKKIPWDVSTHSSSPSFLYQRGRLFTGVSGTTTYGCPRRALGTGQDSAPMQTR